MELGNESNLINLLIIIKSKIYFSAWKKKKSKANKNLRSGAGRQTDRQTGSQSLSVCIRRSLHSFPSLSLTLQTLFLSFLSSKRVILNLRRIPRTPSLSGTSPRIFFRLSLLPLILLRSH